MLNWQNDISFFRRWMGGWKLKQTIEANQRI